jgi:hypothetical protein
MSFPKASRIYRSDGRVQTTEGIAEAIPAVVIVAMSLDRLFLGRLLSSRACLRFTGQSERAILAQDGRDLSIEPQLPEFLFVSLTGSVQIPLIDTIRHIRHRNRICRLFSSRSSPRSLRGAPAPSGVAKRCASRDEPMDGLRLGELGENEPAGNVSRMPGV